MDPTVTFEKLLITAGGRVVCVRCAARSKRSKLQCGRPAMRGRTTCNFHSGKGNSGPKTPQGRAKSIAAHTTHGQTSRAAREAHARASARLLQLEDSMQVLGMTTDTRRSPGRKPRFYEPITDLAGVLQMVLDDVLHPVGGSAGG
jgi:hypothetical protein